MSKSNRSNAPKPTEQRPTPEQPESVATPEQTVSSPAAAAAVPDHLRCPCCFQGLGGVGRPYGKYPSSKTLREQNLVTQRNYLRCHQCGHTWTADVIVETTVVQVDHRLPEGIQTR